MNIYGINNDYSSSIYVKQANNLLIHYVKENSDSSIRCLITLTPTGISVTNCGSTNAKKILLDNNIIYGTNYNKNAYYTIDKYTGIQSVVNEVDIPDHVVNILTTDISVMYSNLNGTIYIAKPESASYNVSTFTKVVYDNNKATVKTFIPLKNKNSSGIIYQRVFALGTYIFTNSEGTSIHNEYSEQLYYDFYTGSTSHYPRIMYYDMPDYTIHIPVSVHYTYNSVKITVATYVFDPSFFKLTYKNIPFTAYVRVR